MILNSSPSFPITLFVPLSEAAKETRTERTVSVPVKHVKGNKFMNQFNVNHIRIHCDVHGPLRTCVCVCPLQL